MPRSSAAAEYDVHVILSLVWLPKQPRDHSSPGRARVVLARRIGFAPTRPKVRQERFGSAGAGARGPRSSRCRAAESGRSARRASVRREPPSAAVRRRGGALGTGQQPSGQSIPHSPSVPAKRGAVSFNRSSTSSRTAVTNAGWVPAVAARANASPSPAAVARASVSRSHSTSRWSETKPVGRHDDRPHAAPRRATQVVVDVRLEPRHLRRSGTRLPDQIEVGARRRGRPRPPGGPSRVAAAAYSPSALRPGRVVHRRRDRMRGEHQPRPRRGAGPATSRARPARRRRWPRRSPGGRRSAAA